MNRRTIFTPQRYEPGRNRDDWFNYLRDGTDPPGLIVKKINDYIGKGVFTEKKVPSGSFLMEYHGEIISKEEAVKRERLYPLEYGSYLLYFKSGRTVLCVDATFSNTCGRYVNDGVGQKKNAELKVVYLGKTPHVVLFATRNICRDEEIRFDYGVHDLPWRQKESLEVNRDLAYVTKECTVLLEKCHLGEPFCYEKKDGTIGKIVCNDTLLNKKQDQNSISKTNSVAEEPSKYPLISNEEKINKKKSIENELVVHCIVVEEGITTTGAEAVEIQFAEFTGKVMDSQQDSDQPSNKNMNNTEINTHEESNSSETVKDNKDQLATKTIVEFDVEDEKSLKNILDVSMGSGIHDVVVKHKPVEDSEHHATVSKSMVRNTVETVEVQKESLEGPHADMNMETEVLPQDTNIMEPCLENSSVTKMKAMGNATKVINDKPEPVEVLSVISDKSDMIVNECTLEETNNKAHVQKDSKIEKLTDKHKDMSNAGDDDVIVVESSSNLMGYRTAEKVITVDKISQSAQDSSDSEYDAADMEKRTKDTEAQLNKIISNDREASPDREKRVKMNRHGFEDIRTKGELLPEDLPPLEELTITVDDSVVMVEVGSIKSIVGILVVIQSNENVPPLNDETILFVEGHKVLGQVFEVFGPVKTPWYSVRFNEATNIEAKGLREGMPVYCAPREDSFTKFVFVDSLRSVKGSDASWENNNEPPEKYLDFSDDEAERRAKAKRRNRKFAEKETEDGEDGENVVHKKNPRQRNRNRGNRDNQTGSGPQQQTQHPKRGWNPFQGNQNENSDNIPPRYGGRPQNQGQSNHANGQRWPQNQNNFNRPQSRFGGPPNFHNRPRMNMNQGQQFGGRNIQHQNNWRPQSNTHFQNEQQGFGNPLINGPTQTNRPFNQQSPGPSAGFGPSQGPSGPVGPSNIDFSQPPPQFQTGNQIRPPNQPAGMNSFVRPQVGMTQQNTHFIASKLTNNQSSPGFNQTMNQQQINAGNMLNQGQPVNSMSFQNNQSNFAHPGNNTTNPTFGNCSNNGMNNGMNQLIQPPPNSRPSPMLQGNTVQSIGSVPQQNYSQFQVNESGKGSDYQNFIPANNNSGGNVGMNPQTYFGQQPSSQRPEAGTFQIQTFPGQNSSNPNQSHFPNIIAGNSQNYVQNQNFRNNQPDGFHQGNGQNSSIVNPGVPQRFGFQSSFVGQNQPAGQGGFIAVSSNSYPNTGNSVMSMGNNVGSYQTGEIIQPNMITDQRFIQNNS